MSDTQYYPPQSSGDLKARLPAALATVIDPVAFSAGDGPTPSGRDHTFDYASGLRLTVTRENVRENGRGEYLHLSASAKADSPLGLAVAFAWREAGTDASRAVLLSEAVPAARALLDKDDLGPSLAADIYGTGIHWHFGSGGAGVDHSVPVATSPAELRAKLPEALASVDREVTEASASHCRHRFPFGDGLRLRVVRIGLADGDDSVLSVFADAEPGSALAYQMEESGRREGGFPAVAGALVVRATDAFRWLTGWELGTPVTAVGCEHRAVVAWKLDDPGPWTAEHERERDAAKPGA